MKLKAKVNGVPSTIEIEMNQLIKYATVQSASGNKVTLKFDGEQETSSLNYIASCQCEVGNKVICINDGLNIVVLGVTKIE